MQALPPALAAFAAYRQFIVYRLEPSATRPGRTDKKPIDHRDGRVTSAQDPAIWTDFPTASAAAARMGGTHGVGFVFTTADPFWFLDIDHALVKGKWSAIVHELIDALPGCAIEVSSGLDGLHLFGTGPIPPHGTRNVPLGLEFYTELRFVALTGFQAVGDAGHAPPRAAEIVERYFPPLGVESVLEAGWWSTAPVPAWRGPTDDTVLIERMLRSKSASATFGQGVSFADLWDADPVALGRKWPADKIDEHYNASHADAALAQHLAFWTGNHADRMLTLMFMSKLVRPKWDRVADYLMPTIRHACAMQTEWLVDLPAVPPIEAPPALPGVPPPPPPFEPGAAVGNTILGPDQQVDYFRGCVYVQDCHRMLLPNGTLVKPEQFKAIYGGRTFVMDRGNARSVRNAFEAYTENQAIKFPSARTTCFRPLLASGAIVVENGVSKVNTYTAVQVPRTTGGDISRFWTHMTKLFPDEGDRFTIVSYMAACVQHQGVKFQWAPLIQGVEGNGKTMLALFVQNAIGKPYVEWPKAKSIGIDFNAWLEGKVFYAVDEIYIAEKHMDLMETLKPMITGDEGIQVTKKGIDSVTRDICGNFMFLTNHRDGLRKSRRDRRIAPYLTPQQKPEDLIRDGLTEAYFADLVDWLKGRRKYEGQPTGYSVIAELLWTFDIQSSHDPRFHVRAPLTTTTGLAISEGLGTAEQYVQEAIDQNEQGFRGGWMSSMAIKRVLTAAGLHLGPRKQLEIPETLGYVLHPALPGGRVHNDVMPDGGRPKLFIRPESPYFALSTVAMVANAYSEAQLK
jgi:hypothetical protein